MSQRVHAFLSLAAISIFALTSGLDAQQASPEQALRALFGEAELERATVVLTEAERARLRRVGSREPVPELVTYYRVVRNGATVAWGYFDAHTVRTHREVLLFVVDPTGRILRVEVFRFGEPPDYRPSEPWLAQFEGRSDPETLNLRSGIAAITGATLTARAATAAARRVLVLHVLVQERGRVVTSGPK